MKYASRAFVAFGSGAFILCIAIATLFWHDANKMSALGQVLGGWAASVSFFGLIYGLLFQAEQSAETSRATQEQIAQLRLQHQQLTSQLNLMQQSTAVNILHYARQLLGSRCMRLVEASMIIQFAGDDERAQVLNYCRNNPAMAAEILVERCQLRQVAYSIAQNPVYLAEAKAYCKTYSDIENFCNAGSMSQSLFVTQFHSSYEQEVYVILSSFSAACDVDHL